MKYTLTTLSPVHIGNGDQISNWSYDVEKNKIKIYNFEKVVRALKNEKDLLKELTKEIENKPLTNCLGSFLKNKGINLKEDYEIPLYAYLSFKNKKKNREEYKQIWEFIKENGKVYIPGTEIKGAIRTAIFYFFLKEKINSDKNFKNLFVSIFEKALKYASIFREDSEGYIDCYDENNKNVQNCLKKAKNEEQKQRCYRNCIKNKFMEKLNPEFKRLEKEIFQNNKNDSRYDFMKFLSISDTDLESELSSILKVVDIIVVGSNKGSVPHELLNENIDFNLTINLPTEEQKSTAKNLYPNIYLLNLEYIAKACNTFSIDLIENEIQDLKRIKENENKEFKIRIIKSALKKLEELKEEFNQQENNNFIIRLGKHEGFLSTTINLLLKKLDYSLYSEVYPHLVPKGYKDNPNKTRRITSKGETLGWCLISKQQNKNKETNTNQEKSKEKIEKVDEEAIKKLQAKLRGEII